VPAKKISLDMFILYTLSTMDPIVEKEYSIVYVHSGMTSENKLSFSWLRKVSSMFTRKYVRNSLFEPNKYSDLKHYDTCYV
jgi:hypothetical protein